MNSFNSDNIIYIREEDGSRTMFSAGELREKLAVSLDAETSEDIALAVEYSLLNRQNRNLETLFDRGELDEAVIRLLEETGFPEAAEQYRSDVHFSGESLEVSRENIYALLTSHLGCSGNLLDRVTGDLLDALQRLDITEASPHLYLELARHFAKRVPMQTVSALPSLPDFDQSCLEKLPRHLSAGTAELIERGVFTVDGLTSIFPCVRFNISMHEFSSFFDISGVVTELFVYPAALRTGAALEECRSKLRELGGGAASRVLPCTLAIRDLRQFVREAFECSGENAVESISLDMGGFFSSDLGENLFKLDFD